MRVDLGDGQWAELKDAEQVTNGDRRHALAKWANLPAEERTAGVVSLLASLDGWLERVVTAWSFEMPLPSDDASVLEKLPLAASNRLYQAVKPLDERSVPDFSPSADPKADTGSSPD